MDGPFGFVYFETTDEDKATAINVFRALAADLSLMIPEGDVMTKVISPSGIFGSDPDFFAPKHREPAWIKRKRSEEDSSKGSQRYTRRAMFHKWRREDSSSDEDDSSLDEWVFLKTQWDLISNFNFSNFNKLFLKIQPYFFFSFYSSFSFSHFPKSRF